MPPASVVVALAHIANEIELEAKAPQELEVAHGEDVAVKFCYVYREVRHDHDPFRLTLRAWTDQELEAARLEHKDHRLRADDQDGFLVVHVSAPGHDAKLHFEAHVHRTLRPWAAEGEGEPEDQGVRGAIRLRTA